MGDGGTPDGVLSAIPEPPAPVESVTGRRFGTHRSAAVSSIDVPAVHGASNHWDVKSSPDLQPSYRPDAGKPIKTPQSDAQFEGMVNKQLGIGTGVLLDSEGMTAERQSHLREVVEQHPEWAGKVRWSS